MSSLPLLLLLLWLSLHACTSRPLFFSHKHTAKSLPFKDSDKVVVLEEFIAASKPRPWTLEEKEVQQGKVLHDDETSVCESGCNASTLKEAEIKISGQYSNQQHSGAATSFQTDSSSLILGKRRQSRSMLGPAQHHVEETVNPSSGDSLEDMVEMDYAQPHRKPPIHNEKP